MTQERFHSTFVMFAKAKHKQTAGNLRTIITVKKGRSSKVYIQTSIVLLTLVPVSLQKIIFIISRITLLKSAPLFLLKL